MANKNFYFDTFFDVFGGYFFSYPESYKWPFPQIVPIAVVILNLRALLRANKESKSWELVAHCPATFSCPNSHLAVAI